MFFPFHNEAAGLEAVVRAALEVAPQVADDYEIILVNDGSRDATGPLCDELARRHPCIRVAHRATNGGYGAAVREGLSRCTKPFVFYTDGDGQYDLQELRRLCDVMDGATLVNGYKMARRDPWYRRALGESYRRLVIRLFRLRVRDVTCDFRLFQRDAIDPGVLRSSSSAICVELVAALQRDAGRIIEVPVHHYPRRHGRSRFFRPRHLWQLGRELVALWWRRRLDSAQPIHQVYARIAETHWWYVGMRRLYLDWLGRSRSHLLMVDLGCGSGWWMDALASANTVIGLDVSPEALSCARSRHQGRLCRATATRLPLTTESVDLVTSLDMLCQLRPGEDLRALAEMRRVLKPGGRLLLNLPAYDWLRGPHDEAVGNTHRYTAAEVRAKLHQAGFVIERISYANALMCLPGIAFRLVRKWLRLPGHDLEPPAPFLNRFLLGALDMERRWLRRQAWPFGWSIVCLARKIR